MTSVEKQEMDSSIDLEKDAPEIPAESIKEGTVKPSNLITWLEKLLLGSAEARGIQPVPIEERTDKRGINLITLWFAANCSLLPIATGFAGTLSYGLNLRDASLVIICFSLLSMIPVAWMGRLGPQTGMRQMIQARYFFGLYAVVVLVVFQLATLTGYTIITAIVSGQTLAAVSGGHLSLTIGIVITALLGLGVSFMGYKVLHIYENYSWIPTMIAIIITAGIGGKNLMSQTTPPPPTARAVVSFASIVVSFTISWAAIVSDFSVYISPEVRKERIFSYVYIGYLLPSIPLLILGAAIGSAVPNVPSWSAAWAAYSTGGVMYAMVESTGGFGKFIAVILAFSVIGNTACSLYSLSISLQTLLPFFMRVPRYAFSIIITIIVIPISIIAAKNFLQSLGNFLGIIGYWTIVFIGIAITEHQWFRKGNPDTYDSEIWNVGSKLPIGAAALCAAALSFTVIIPSMDALWYAGPIAKHTGDLGIELGLCLSVILYLPLRTLEKRLTSR